MIVFSPFRSIKLSCKIIGGFGLIPILLPSVCGAWDSPLPMLGQPAGTDLAAFANPAAATRLDGAGTGFSFGNPDSAEGPGNRLWAMHHQEDDHALGLRLWEGGAKTEADFGMTSAKDAFGWLSSGGRLSYRYREDAADRFGFDAGFQARPHPAAMLGYWGENLWTSRPAIHSHRFTLGLKPFAGAKSRAGDLSIGYGMDFPEDRGRREYLFVQVPLPMSGAAQAKWDWNDRSGSVGIQVQATGQMVAAWGLKGPRGNPSDWGLPRHREVAFRFRKHQKTPYLLGHGRVAELDLNHDFVEGETPRGFFGTTDEVGFLELRRRMDLIEADPRVKAVVVRLGKARTGWGMGEEIRDRLAAWRAGGRRIVAYMEQATPLNYYLGSVADVVALQPGGHFTVNGFASEVTFFKGFFEKVGVQPQFLRHGRYKSFEEPYTRKDLSPEARANLQTYLSALWNHYVDAVAESRKLPRDSVRRALDSGDINLDFALKARLIDTLVDQDQLLELAGGRQAGIRRFRAEDVYRGDWEIAPRIALVIVQGDMVMGGSSKGWLGSPELAGAKSVSEQLRRARKDPDIKAVVIRVESPGGSAQAADIMTREVELIRKEGKPVVASIGHMAASGGYYLVCGADRIYSGHNSAVGSIGILWGKFILSGLYAKLGLATETVKTSPHADATSMARALDSGEAAVVQRHMDVFYDRFVSKVAAGRKLSREAVDSLAQGRIFTGSQAVANGLVDRIGGLDSAIREAARMAGIPEDRRVALATGLGRKGQGWATPGRAEGPGPLPMQSALEGLIDRYGAMAEAQVWAVSPELAGWQPE